MMMGGRRLMVVSKLERFVAEYIRRLRLRVARPQSAPGVRFTVRTTQCLSSTSAVPRGGRDGMATYQVPLARCGGQRAAR